MKAAQINTYGDASVITLKDVDMPEATADTVVIEVHAASINPFDSKLRSGAMKDFIPLTFPFTLGGDIAGVVTQVGNNVSSFAVGDKVYGQAIAISGGSGAFAEYALAPTKSIAKMPNNLNFEEAASLPLAGVSALQALVDHIQLQSGQKILITGGSGGIGIVAIQIAKHLGAHVTTTVNAQDISFAKALGADEALDYKTTNLDSLPQDFDAVLNTAMTDTSPLSTLLKPGGHLVSLLGVDGATASSSTITATPQMTSVTAAALESLGQLVGSGVVTPHIGRSFPLSQTAEAFQFKETQHTVGKVVVTIR